MKAVILLVFLLGVLWVAGRTMARAGRGPTGAEGFQGATGDVIRAGNDDDPALTENSGSLPWESHPITDSVPLDLRDKYPQAYYHELDNNAYQEMLGALFAVAPDRYARAIRADAWTDDLGTLPDLVPGYEAAVGFLGGRLAGAPVAPIQVVHDRWWSCHQARGDPTTYLYKLEALLYRPFRSHAKHVAMDVMVEKKANGTYQFDVIGVAILGMVSEDKVALFPVRAFDPVTRSEAPMEGTPFTARDLLLLDDAMVAQIVEKVRENRAKEATEGRR